MRTFFNYIANLTESNFVNITGDTEIDLKQFKKDVEENRFTEFPYIEQFTLQTLSKDFLQNTEVVKLEPLSEKALYGQLYWLTGTHNASSEVIRKNEGLILNDKTFIFASQTEEDLYKLKAKHKEELEEFTRLHKYDNYGKVIIDLHNTERWAEGLILAKKGEIVEMTEDTYDHFLGCVSPMAFCSVSFVCGEPERHNNKGEGVYLCGIKKRGKFYAQYGTVKEYKAKQLFKSI